MRTTPFQIHFGDDALDDLRRRARATRWAAKLPEVGWEHGTNADYLKELVAYWADGYDWRATEARLNAYPNFKADIDGTEIHYVHKRAADGKGLPIILTHGWPSTYLEYLPVLDRLTDPAKFGLKGPSFDVVVPSLPGYGFSERPMDRRVDYRCTARLWHGLMQGLGYARFSAGGGDFGAGVNTFLALEFPEAVERLHVSFLEVIPYSGPGSRPMTAAEADYVRRMTDWVSVEHGYLHIQSTKPQTLGVGLTDSPAGLAAWIVEKWRSWGDCGGDLTGTFGHDLLLDTITLYWLTNTITTSMIDYYDNRPYFREEPGFAAGLHDRVGVPTGFANWPKGLGQEVRNAPPREWVERLYNVVYWSQIARGGHFSAIEEPDLYAADMIAFFTAAAA